MTPDFLNISSSSFSHDAVEQKDQDHQPHFKFFFSQYNEDGSSSLSPSPTSFGSNLPYYEDQGQTSDVMQSHEYHNQQEGEISESVNSGGSVKYWMSSKVRVMQKMSNYTEESEKPATTRVNSTKRAQRYALEKLAVHRASPKQDKTQTQLALKLNFVHTNNGALLRVCSDCNTTTTPLWRSGPRGPKSLCNACGIRQRKARRALAEAAAAGAGAGNYSPAKSGYNYKLHSEKKCHGNHNINGHNYNKEKFKLKASSGSPNSSKLCFRDFAGFGVNDNDCSAFSGVFPQDVAEAASLLMQLSCHGFVHS